MTEWRNEIEDALAHLLKVAELAGDPISDEVIEIKYLPAPHTPPSNLPPGKIAVYGFWGDGGWLKIGKAGPKSGPRYVSHHYYLKAPSTLAKSLAADPRFQTMAGFDPLAPAAWIRASTHRVNILMEARRGPAMLALLEAFLHLRLKPRYEGFASQRTRDSEDE